MKLLFIPVYLIPPKQIGSDYLELAVKTRMK
jgi:hypothetical protein